MLMHNPPHPGQVVKRSLIDGAQLSVTEAAKALGVGRVTLSKLINKKSGISPEMAVRLSLALNTSSEMWMNIQSMYDLWQAEKSEKNFMLSLSNIYMLRHIPVAIEDASSRIFNGDRYRTRSTRLSQIWVAADKYQLVRRRETNDLNSGAIAAFPVRSSLRGLRCLQAVVIQ